MAMHDIEKIENMMSAMMRVSKGFSRYKCGKSRIAKSQKYPAVLTTLVIEGFTMNISY